MHSAGKSQCLKVRCSVRPCFLAIAVSEEVMTHEQCIQYLECKASSAFLNGIPVMLHGKLRPADMTTNDFRHPVSPEYCLDFRQAIGF